MMISRNAIDGGREAWKHLTDSDHESSKGWRCCVEHSNPRLTIFIVVGVTNPHSQRKAICLLLRIFASMNSVSITVSQKRKG